MTTTTTLYDEALAAARRLTLADRLRLASALVSDAASAVAPMPHPYRSFMTPDEARAALAEIRDYLASLPQPRRTLGEQLDADRRDRMRALMGRDPEDDDVDS